MNIFSSLILFAAVVGQDVVAPGFPSWEGVTAKNYIRGRQVTPSDLRHRVVVVVNLAADTHLHSNFLKMAPAIAGLDGIPAGHMVQWDTMETMPRECIVLVSLSGEQKTAAETYAQALKVGKDEQPEVSQKLQNWSSGPAVYFEAALSGFTPGDAPYVYILDGKSAEPVWKGTFKGTAEVKAIQAAVRKAKAALEPWTPLTGIAEPKFFVKEQKKLMDGKPSKPILAALAAGIKSKNEEQAKEAQIMFDALNQYASDLKFRIVSEFGTCPARAFVDFQQLLRVFPQEKKSLAEIDARLKQNKEVLTIGKIFEKYIEWSAPDFQFKNASEAKRAVQLTTSWKKTLEKLADDSKNTRLQGEASLILAQLDALGEMLMSKVPQK